MRATLKLAAAGVGLVLVAGSAACRSRASHGPLRFRITLAMGLAPAGASGRLFVFMTDSLQEGDSLAAGFVPGDTWIAAAEVADVEPGQAVDFDPDSKAYPRPFSQAGPGAHRVMALLDVDHSYGYSGRDAGDLCSPIVELPDLAPASAGPVALVLDRVTQSARDVEETDTIKPVELQSRLLTAFWNRPVVLRAGVVLPPSYTKSPDRTYPTLYHIHGFGGDYTEAWQAGPALYEAMAEGRAGEMVHVFLDASFPTGHHLFADSDCNGPWGRVLVEELIPYLELRFRLTARPDARFLTGHSSGGWSSLWLQITYPDLFGGTWSTAPDPVDFRSFIGIDVTPGSTENAYRTRDGRPRNLVRAGGRGIASVEEFARQEEVKGEDGGQLASFEWAWSPRGPDGRPLRLFDRETGELNPDVERAWQRYDIRDVLEKNWARLGPKLRGKITVIVGGEDTYHLEAPMELLRDALARVGSDAVCEIVPGRDHDNLYEPYASYPDGLAARIDGEIEAKLSARRTSAAAGDRTPRRCGCELCGVIIPHTVATPGRRPHGELARKCHAPARAVSKRGSRRTRRARPARLQGAALDRRGRAQARARRPHTATDSARA